MSTIAPPSKPLSPALVDSEHYIDDQIRRTRRALKLVDLAAGLITLAIGLLGFVLLAAVLDHWVIPGGLSEWGRIGVFGLMLAALGWYAWRTFVPLLRPINPVYAAQTIERGAPSLKNSLLNLLLFRTHRQQMSARVYHALEQQAALRLSSAPIDTSIDRTALLRLGYALVLIIAVCAAYAVLSPKNMAVSAARVFAPWTDLAPPSRVQIIDLKPGDTAVALGEQVEISAEVDGLREGESVRIRYSTIDEQLVDQSAPMQLPAANARRFTGLLPPSGSDLGRGDNRETLGVQTDLVYWIEAGDARSKRFKVNVFTRPTITVQKVRYDYPAYTGFGSNETSNTGDISGLEGTQVTISAQANKPIKSAYIDFDADGRSDLKMNVDGDLAMASFKLALREDRRTPKHGSYVLKFTSVENRTNDDPPTYKIDVKPDYAPEVRITEPEEPELTVRVDETVMIGVEARDPDFALGGVRLVGKVGSGAETTLIELAHERHEGRFGAIRPFTPVEAKLKPGDVLEYWAEARDNRRPDANVAMSEHRRLRIASPSEPGRPDPGARNQQQQGGGQQGDQQQNGESGAAGESASADGQQGQQQEGGDQGDQQNGENQGQQGPGGAGAQGQQNNKAQSEQGAGGQGNAGNSQDNSQQNEPGEGGGSGANNAEQQQNEQQKGGAGNSQTQGGQPQAQNQQQPGDNSPADGQPGEQQNGGAQPSGQQGAPSEKVSSQGDDDAKAFQRIAEHLNKQNSGESASADGQSAQQQQAQPGEQQDQQPSEGQQQDNAQQQGAQPNQGQNARRTQGQQNGANQAHQQGERSDQQQGAEGEPASGENTAASEENAAADASEKNPQQKPSPQGAQSNEPRQDPGDAQQQGASQQDGERQGADTPRESKPGDGMNQQGAQQPSAESNVNNNQSDAGAGHNSDEQQGAASQNNMQGAEKRDGDRNQKLQGDEEPPSGANSPRESDSEGGQSGDQSGGGQDGAGQHADAPGKGSPGQNEAADTGGGRADEQGEGETGSKPGDQQLADGETGQSSGDQPGAGSQQRKAEEQSPTQSGEPVARDPGEQASPEGQPGDRQGQDKAGGQQPQQPQAGDAQQQQPGDESPSSDGKPREQQPQNGNQQQQQQANEQQPAGAQQRQAGDQQSSNQSQSGQSGTSQPEGGGQGGVAQSSDQPLSKEAREDEANLDYARQQTNLVLERLDDQLAKQQVDQNMLKSLGWTQEELRQFVDRWKGLKERAERDGNDAAEAREELDDALRSLGLRKQGQTRTSNTSKDDKLRVNDSYRTRPPVEYADRVRAYSKSVSSGE